MDVRRLIYLSAKPSAEIRQFFEQCDWQVKSVRSVKEVAKAVDGFDAAGGLLDLAAGLPLHEIEALDACLAMPNIGWVAIVSPGQLADSTMRRLVRDYCSDYVTVPVVPERAVRAVGHARGMATLAGAPQQAPVHAVTEGDMIGSCESMQALFRSIKRVASTDAPVFIAGESGTGKELTAAAIHQRSSRRDAPFVAINCGAISRELVQSELFGHERGAFTGATQRRIGRVEAANGGTLFLDEIGDLPLESQASLLRFLQERKIERLGGQESIDVDVRIISATHVDLDAAIADGRFRHDLYHRLCVLRIVEPPLRERGADIELLAFHLLGHFRRDAGRRLQGFAPDAMDAMRRHTWPGNVRELGNRIRRAVVMAEGRLITAKDLELDHLVDQMPVSLNVARETAERMAIERALLRHRGRYGEAARDLGISRVTLYRLMDAYRMREPDSAEPKPDKRHDDHDDHSEPD
ncbi:sigma-54 dependent transcriptional regulator [Paraburkholderia diazotrophica]|uniref:Sigma54 specific transcriptional regulator, Fis family n=1 Tax=Paraburkholderia diazotrophica TaxID=667676 RepID=A0A1H6VZH8_9BURK|nr:sigma-54 dependent transcriptional regulator [Paraburkholderia diazotrophica]SEJ08504.1 sigma54 specific transcriptional regulator, Fis family [Paraburkholderia diazotrophica]